MISGASGSGKSALVLDLISRGAQLVADDQVQLRRREDTLWCSAPAAIKGRVEARGIGILNAPSCDATQVHLWVDMDKVETQRLPDWHTISRLGVTLPLLFKVPHPHFAPAILLYLSYGRSA